MAILTIIIIGMITLKIEHLTVSWNERDKRSECQSQLEISQTLSLVLLKFSGVQALNTWFMHDTLYICLRQRQLQKPWKYIRLNWATNKYFIIAITVVFSHLKSEWLLQHYIFKRMMGRSGSRRQLVFLLLLPGNHHPTIHLLTVKTQTAVSHFVA